MLVARIAFARPNVCALQLFTAYSLCGCLRLYRLSYVAKVRAKGGKYNACGGLYFYCYALHCLCVLWVAKRHPLVLELCLDNRINLVEIVPLVVDCGAQLRIVSVPRLFKFLVQHRNSFDHLRHYRLRYLFAVLLYDCAPVAADLVLFLKSYHLCSVFNCPEQYRPLSVLYTTKINNFNEKNKFQEEKNTKKCKIIWLWHYVTIFTLC